MEVVALSDVDGKEYQADRSSTIGYCVPVEEKLVSWKSRKQNVVTCSSEK